MVVVGGSTVKQCCGPLHVSDARNETQVCAVSRLSPPKQLLWYHQVNQEATPNPPTYVGILSQKRGTVSSSHNQLSSCNLHMLRSLNMIIVVFDIWGGHLMFRCLDPCGCAEGSLRWCGVRGNRELQQIASRKSSIHRSPVKQILQESSARR